MRDYDENVANPKFTSELNTVRLRGFFLPGRLWRKLAPRLSLGHFADVYGHATTTVSWLSLLELRSLAHHEIPS